MNDRMLRTALWIDSAACGAMGLVFALGAAALDDTLGIPTGWLVGIGAVLLACAGGLGWLAAMPAVPPSLGRAVVVGNAGWVAASVATVVAGWFPLTGLGTAIVIAQAVAVVVILDLEWIGLRRATAVTA